VRAALTALAVLATAGCAANTDPLEDEEEDAWWDEAPEGDPYDDCGSCDVGRDPGDDGTDPEPDTTCAPLTCADVLEMCGPLDDGCGGTIECGCPQGTECTAGVCGCLRDPAEPNDATGQAHGLGTFSDRPHTTRSYDAFGLDRPADVDWYQLVVDDGLGDGNPNVRITVSDVPDGSEWEVSVWYDCAGETGGGDCRTGHVDDEYGSGCTADNGGTGTLTVEIEAQCSGWREDGTAIVRVRSTTWVPICLPYTLEVDVD
jgi:hypothetical protein